MPFTEIPFTSVRAVESVSAIPIEVSLPVLFTATLFITEIAALDAIVQRAIRSKAVLPTESPPTRAIVAKAATAKGLFR